MSISIPGWALGTFFGVIMGNVLPASVVSALSIGIYGMFLAIIIPPARKNKIILGLVSVSMILSFAFSVIPFIKLISSGMQVIILTVGISLIAAIFFPVEDEANEE
jgi:predicted branched-subunit amino acid permease